VAGWQEAVKTLAAGALTLLAGCTPMPRFGVVNETPVTVTLHIDGDPGTLGWQEKVVLLQPGEERSFRAATMFNSGFVRFRIGGCDYEYDWQEARRRSEKGALLGVIVQLENDMTARLRPVAVYREGNGPFRFETREAISVPASVCLTTSPP